MVHLLELKGKLRLSKIGFVRMFMHRPLKGNAKTLTIEYGAGEGYIIFACEAPEPEKKPIEWMPGTKIKGGDLGLLEFLTLSDSRTIEPPKYLRRAKEKLNGCSACSQGRGRPQ